jgi:glycosyltransferase involved in cell wall biosynthesis
LNLALISEALTTGGAETFVLRLASALQKNGLTVSVIVLRGDLIHQEIVKTIAPNISVLVIRIPLLRLALKLDGMLFRCGINFSIVRWYQVRRLKEYLSLMKADLVHSHLLSTDLVTARACALASTLPWVTTMHGDYLAFESRGCSRAARILDFKRTIREVEQSVKHLISITDQQLSQLIRLMPHAAASGRISKIYNGYTVQTLDSSRDEPPAALNLIPEDAFVIGMVARGIRDKGWEVILNAFTTLNRPDIWLVLVGDGSDLQALKRQVTCPRIIFTGNVPDPLRYIARFDVGCLPSRIPTESLPTVVVEYMVLGKPVIVSDVGEMPRMIAANSDEPAGILIPLTSVEEMSRQMQAALERIYRDSTERARLATNARVAARKFEMNLCVDAYLAIYRAAIYRVATT